jgi:hypothetical protein
MLDLKYFSGQMKRKEPEKWCPKKSCPENMCLEKS